MLLSRVNAHSRDKYIEFQEEGHKYFLTHPINNTLLTPISTTTLIKSYHEEFNDDKIIQRMMASPNWINSKYYGKTPDEIKFLWKTNKEDAAELGTLMHADIERYLNKDDVLNSNTLEFKYFIHFWEQFKIKYSSFDIFRTEMLIFDENFRNGTGISGSIDALLKNDQDQFIILDWKRSKEIKETNIYQKMLKPFNNLDDTNKNHYALQLNIYRHILTTKYQYNVVFMMLVVLHPNQGGFKCIPIEYIELADLWDKL